MKYNEDFSDEKILNSINTTRFLNEETKERYLRRLDLIQTEIWKDCDNKGYNLYCIIQHPEEFAKKLSKFSGGPGYMTAMMSIFTYNQSLKELEIYDMWKRESDLIREEKRAHYRKNEPTEKQRNGFMTFEEICKIRDSLLKSHKGTPELLLLQLYTEMPPIRANDFYSTLILRSDPLKKNKKTRKIIPKSSNMTKKKIKELSEEVSDKDTIKDNYIIVPKSKNGVITLVLQDYKTVKSYSVQRFDLPKSVSLTIREMLEKEPERKYLFLSKKGKKYNSRRAYNDWANGVLRKLLNNNDFSLTLFRHIYISRKDLNLRSKSGEEQEKVARKMCHSISSQQGSYHWMENYINPLE